MNIERTARALRAAFVCSRGTHWNVKYDSGLANDIGRPGTCEDCGERIEGIKWNHVPPMPKCKPVKDSEAMIIDTTKLQDRGFYPVQLEGGAWTITSWDGRAFLDTAGGGYGEGINPEDISEVGPRILLPDELPDAQAQFEQYVLASVPGLDASLLEHKHDNGRQYDDDTINLMWAGYAAALGLEGVTV